MLCAALAGWRASGLNALSVKSAVPTPRRGRCGWRSPAPAPPPPRPASGPAAWRLLCVSRNLSVPNASRCLCSRAGCFHWTRFQGSQPCQHLVPSHGWRSLPRAHTRVLALPVRRWPRGLFCGESCPSVVHRSFPAAPSGRRALVHRGSPGRCSRGRALRRGAGLSCSPGPLISLCSPGRLPAPALEAFLPAPAHSPCCLPTSSSVRLLDPITPGGKGGPYPGARAPGPSGPTHAL